MTIREFIRSEVFTKRAAERGCLVVYDSSRRYREIVRSMATDTCRVIDASDSIIEQREAAMVAVRDLAEGQINQLVVWSPSAPPEDDDRLQVDPLGALSRFGAVFPVGDGDTYESLCRRAKPDHVVEVEKLFAAGEPNFETVDALDSDGSWPKLKTLLHANSPKEILVGLLSPADHQEADLKADNTWSDETREFVFRTLGHRLRTRGQSRGAIAEELWRLILFSEFVFDSYGELPASLATVPKCLTSAKALVFDVCDDLRKHDDHRQDYMIKASEVERDLELPERSRSVIYLGQRDTFSFEERVFLGRFVEAMRAGQLDDARGILNSRRTSIWLTEEGRMAEWLVAERVLALIETIGRLPAPTFSSLESTLLGYVGQWRELDQRYRELEQAMTQWHDDHDGIEALVGEARQRYLKLAASLQAEFLRHVQAEGWPAHGPQFIRNSEVFAKEVAPEFAAGQKVAYFLVDSLRYELGVELEKQLSGKGKVRLRLSCGQLPTYTEVGMASLMPDADKALFLARKNDKLVTTLEGATATNPKTRLDYLRSKTGDLCHDIELEDLIHKKKLKLDERVRLLVVRTREIDAVAHESPRGVLQLIPSLVRDILRGVAKVEAAGFQKAVIATDHGFILVHEQEAGNVTTKPPGNWLIEKSRCLLGEGSADGGSMVLAREDLGIPGDFSHYAAPKALVPYTSAHLYYHEGLSLQECVLPCLTVELRSQAAPKRLATLQVTYKQGKADKITSRRPVIDIGWSELALEEAEIEVAIDAIDSKGVVVGSVSSGQTVNPATQGVRIRQGQIVAVGLRMDDEFAGSFTIRVMDPATQAQYAELKLKTDYAV